MHELPIIPFPSSVPVSETLVVGTAQVPLVLKGMLIDKLVITDDMLYPDDANADHFPVYELSAFLSLEGKIILHKSDLVLCEEEGSFEIGFQKYVLIESKEAAHRFFTIRIHSHITSPACYLNWLQKIALDITSSKKPDKGFFFLTVDELTKMERPQ